MNAEIDLIYSCTHNQFPCIRTMCLYGLNGEGKANPIDVIKCYKTAFLEDGVTEHDLREYDDMNKMFEEKTVFLKDKIHYKRLVLDGGIKISKKGFECDKCFYNGTPRVCC